jgi:uncharacterized protein (DUF427 family)
MARAIWKNKILAEAEDYQLIEGDVYFPPETVNREYLRESDHSTVCSWKGTARYYHVQVDGESNANAAWYYPTPTDQARVIKDHIAFWKGVVVEP